MSDSSDTQRQKLMAKYLALSAPEQNLVNLLAVNWVPLTLTQIKTALGLLQKNKLDLSPLEQQGMIVRETPRGYPFNTGGGPKCNPAIVELVTRRLVADGNFKKYVETVRRVWPLKPGSGVGEKAVEFNLDNDQQLLREARIGLYLGDERYITRVFEIKARSPSYYWPSGPQRPTPEQVYLMVCSNPFEAAWFESRPLFIRNTVLPELIKQLVTDWQLNDDCYASLAALGRELPACQSELAYAALLRGDPAAVSAHLATGVPNSLMALSIGAMMNLFLDKANEAIKTFEETLRLQRKQAGSKKTCLPRVQSLLYLLALSLRNEGKDLDNAQTYLNQILNHGGYGSIPELLQYSVSLEKGSIDTLGACRDAALRALAQATRETGWDPWTTWLALFTLYRYADNPDIAQYAPAIEAMQNKLRSLGLLWLAAEIGGLLARLHPKLSHLAGDADAVRNAGLKPFVDRVRREEPWERALNAIRNSVAPAPAQAPAKTDGNAELRLAWFLSESYSRYSLEAREQKRSAKGTWTKGKEISLKRLKETADTMAHLTEQDRRMIGHITLDPYYHSYYLIVRGWLALAGHPAVFWSSSGTPVEVMTADPELRVRKQKNGQIRIELWPQLEPEQRLVFTKEGLNRLKLTEIKPEHHRIAGIIGKGFEAPAAARAQILESLGAVSSLLAVHSDIGGTEVASAEAVPADPRLRVQLLPEGEGLRAALLVRPFGDQGSYYLPGAGGAGLIAEIGGKRLQTQRDLKQERKHAAELIAACPSLMDSADPGNECQWLLEDTESSLELLLELGTVGERAVIEWPQGEKFKVLGRADTGQMSLQVKQQRDWFNVSGELQLDTQEVVQMQLLLSLIGDKPGKFVCLDGNRFLALTDTFRKRLEELRAYTEQQGKDRRIHPLALPALEDLAADVGEFKTDAAWRKQIDRLREAEKIQPKLPSTLQAELRDYQQEGFNWLSRLAAWGVGACLADDMGLGKTLQAIAVLLDRAKLGPSLVIAPTSVCFNWQNEVARFAPTLNFKTLGPTDRQQLIDGLGPMDLLACSYGLLQQEAVAEMLAKVSWNMIVLDEAQAIKNAATRRSQQAMALQGEFKLITTGTPVENHLGELWNLFRFVNPGLLGSLESFNRRFAGPIERDQNREARQRLKRLIQPYILRRTKSQVLDELPARTEIELQVELGEQEAAFYEALRRKLLEELNEAGGPIEDQRFKVLAAITKLRRACCNPNLVAPELGLSSSKLAQLAEVLEELLDNKHKALIFSQFVDHLNLVRAHLEEKGVSYQYLDGQTPAPERKKRVEAFQAGEGEVFLISLKAGGVGLNLTAADYVIHMDPWWNPAVEDQASDRAHRIGQTRPVTIYRLVARGTIEEQIVSLHRQKRELADSLLEDGEMSARIGAEDLLELMRSGGGE